jgi:hypothetical protein
MGETNMLYRPDVERLIALDPSETASGYDCPERAARMAQNFENYNAAQMQADTAQAWLGALKPVLWLLVAVFLALVALQAFAGAVAGSADPSLWLPL